MKIGGFKTPQELEAYGEEKFFTDFPEAKKLAMGGTPEAFPQIATADKFFSYGVPVPPTYYEQGGATGLPNIYPQIQSEQQFFAPVYTNSNNAYKAGGSYEEAFPQAVSYPQAGWGKTNYFMLAGGGAFPPGMPQYTGMLPVMQAGSGLSGINTRTEEDMNHYYSAYPMMAGGQPSLQEGGQGTENADQSFYVNKMQNFISKLQKNGQKAIMKSIETVDEVPPMSGMRYGGMPKYQSDEYSGEIDLTAVPGSIMLDPAHPNYVAAYAAMARKYINGSNANSSSTTTAPVSKSSTGTSGGVSTKVAPEAKPTAGNTGTTKATAPTSGTTSKPAAKTTTPKVRTTEELNAEIAAEKESASKSKTVATGPTNTGTETDQSNTASTTQTDSSKTVTPTGWEGWTMQTLPDGTQIPIKNGVPYYQIPMYTGYPSYPNYRQPQPQQNYGSFLDYIPGGGLRRKSANLILAAAMANNDLSQYEIDPRSVVTRRALLPGNRLKSFDLVRKGTASGPITSNLQTEPAKTTQVPVIQDPNAFQSALPPMTTEEKVQRAYDWNFRSGQPSYGPQAPVIGPEGPVKSQTGPYNLDYSPMPSEAQPQSGITFDRNNPEHVKQVMGAILDESMKRYGGPYALPMFQSDMFSGENPFGGVEVNIAPNPVQDTYWNTGQTDQLNEQARQIEKENDPFKTMEDRLPAKFKRQGPFANLSADQMIAGMDTLAGIFNKYGSWNQENIDFNTAKQVFSKSNARNSQGAYFTNQPGIGLGFRSDQANANVRGMYAQYGGQGFYTGDNYYLTMPTIKNVKKAGAFKPGK